MHQLNLTSLDIFDNYLNLLKESQDKLFQELNEIQKLNIKLRSEDIWNDLYHLKFTEEHIKEIIKGVHTADNAYYNAISELNELKNFYSQII